MKKQVSLAIKLQFLWMLLFSAGTLSAQKADSLEIFKDSMDRYGAIGIRPGAFFNLNKENRFTLPVMGVFIDYSFGKFRHSIEMDFLTRRARKFFKNTYSPCLTYHFAVKKQLKHQMELYGGAFVNCRKDVLNCREYMDPLDSSYFKRGFHTILSAGPSVEINRRFFYGSRNSFLMLGMRLAYSFDILGFGSTYYGMGIPPSGSGRIAAAERFQRDAVALTLKLAWGKLVNTRQPKPKPIEF